jgi:hypothetical protein
MGKGWRSVRAEACSFPVICDDGYSAVRYRAFVQDERAKFSIIDNFTLPEAIKPMNLILLVHRLYAARKYGIKVL